MRRKCTAEAAYSVKALVPALDHPFFEYAPVEVFCGLRLCARCVQAIRIKDIFTEELCDTVSRMMHTQHHKLPDFPRSKLQIISINDLELLALEARHETIH